MIKIDTIQSYADFLSDNPVAVESARKILDNQYPKLSGIKSIEGYSVNPDDKKLVKAVDYLVIEGR